MQRIELFADLEAYQTARRIAGQYFTPTMAKSGDRRFFTLRQEIYDALIEAKQRPGAKALSVDEHVRRAAAALERDDAKEI
jgi:hypothetical protein